MATFNLRPASKKWTVNGAPGSSSSFKQLATSAVIVRGVVVTGGGGSAVIRIFDSRNGTADAGPNPNHYILGANAGESTVSPIQHDMEQGLYIELEQGGDSNGEATVFYD